MQLRRHEERQLRLSSPALSDLLGSKECESLGRGGQGIVEWWGERVSSNEDYSLHYSIRK